MFRMPPDIVAGLGGADLAALGIPSEADYLAAYCRRVDRPMVSEADYAFCIAFNFFRLAAIFHGIRGRVARGTAASAHARERAASYPRLVALARDSMEACL
jgi:aminoglycoside phosphotransferase (APT) family kinase protein